MSSSCGEQEQRFNEDQKPASVRSLLPDGPLIGATGEECGAEELHGQGL